MKQTTKYRKLWICMFAVMLFLAVMPAAAKAANYQLVNISTATQGARTKVGKYYFYGAYDKDRKYNIYTSTSKTKSGKSLGIVKLMDSSCSILTNGSRVYYVSSEDWTETYSKHVVYGVDVNGKNQKKLCTIIDPKSYNRVFLVKVYGDQIYYRTYDFDAKTSVLGSISAKTGKKKIVANGYDGSVYTKDSERYMYLTGGTSVEAKKSTVKVYDCKKNKVIKTYSVKKPAGTYSYLDVSITKKYCYFLHTIGKKETEEFNTYKIYRCAQNGTGKPKLMKTIKCSNGGLKGDLFYYIITKETEPGVFSSTYYRYNITKNQNKKISKKAYFKEQGIPY